MEKTMRDTPIKILGPLAFSVCLFIRSAADAQSCRTWVSAIGDDGNPCSRTLPCKTFQGALNQTSEGGEISVLDPGGYGNVTITKSITIDGGTGSGWASILASGANGIVVNVTTNPGTAVVILRNLSINGTRRGPCVPGLNGIRYLAGSKLIIENCTIFGFSQKAIDVNLAATGTLTVTGTTIEDVNDGIAMTNSAGTMKGVISDSRITNTSNSGLNLLSGTASISNSVISNNTSFGVIAQGGSAINVTDCVLSHNTTAISAAASFATVRISNNHILKNNTGVDNSGTVVSAVNNKFLGNTADTNGAAITSCLPDCVK